MENKLKKLFDFQKFQGNKRLADMVAEVENFITVELSDDDLNDVAAAGDSEISKNEDINNDD